MGSLSFAKPFTSGRFLPIIIKNKPFCNGLFVGYRLSPSVKNRFAPACKDACRGNHWSPTQYRVTFFPEAYANLLHSTTRGVRDAAPYVVGTNEHASPQPGTGLTAHWSFDHCPSTKLVLTVRSAGMKKLPPENREGDIFREIRPACSSSESWSSSCGLRCSCAAGP